MSGKKSNLPDGRIPDRLPDGRPAVAWRSRWIEGVLPLWLVATAGGMAVIFVVGLFFYGGGHQPEGEHAFGPAGAPRHGRTAVGKAVGDPAVRQI